MASQQIVYFQFYTPPLFDYIYVALLKYLLFPQENNWLEDTYDDSLFSRSFFGLTH